MKKLSKVVCLSLALAMVFALAACAGGSTGAPSSGAGSTAAGSTGASTPSAQSGSGTTLRVANYFAESHPTNTVLVSVFKPKLEESGRFKVELYPNNQLGAEKEFSDALKMGDIEMGVLGTMMATQFPRLFAVEFPYLFDSTDQLSSIMNQLKDELNKGLDGVDLKILGVSINGVRAVSNSVRPINSFADVKGLKLRLPQTEYYVDMGKLWGLNGITMSLSEVFTAMQQGVVDGQENPPTTVLANGWYEVQKYEAITDHCIAGNNLTVNLSFFNGLSADDQKILQDAVDAYIPAQLEAYNKSAQDDIQKLKDHGMTITYPDKQQFKDATMPLYDMYSQKYPDLGDIFDKINALKK